MRTPAPSCPVRLAAVAVALCLTALWPAAAHPQANQQGEEKPKEKAEYSNTQLGRDPQAFASAAAMFKVAARGPCDAAPDRIAEMLQAGASLDSAEVRDAILAENPCRGDEAVQTAASEWADLAAARFIGQGANAPPGALAEANERYAAGDFKAATAKYLVLLRQAPKHLDARNNLALAHMHLGNDLLAEVDLEVLRRLDAKYLPAIVNLTVVCERQGLRTRALAAAREAVRLQREAPAAAFNLAWFAEVYGAHDVAETLLKPLSEMDDAPSRRALIDLNHRELEAGSAAALLTDELDDPHLGWGVYDSGQYYDSAFANGSYVMTVKHDKCSVEYVKPQLELPANFDIELVSTWKSGISNTAYGLDFGKSKDDRYHFGLSGNGQSVIWAYGSDTTLPDPMAWKAATAAAGDGSTPNSQRIAVRGDLISYYVDGVFAGSFVSRIAFSPSEWVVGLRVCGKETVAFDRLRIIKR